MCQMYGPSCHVQCVKCGESYLENLPHKCKPEERDSVPSAPTPAEQVHAMMTARVEDVGMNFYAKAPTQAAAPTASVPTLEEEAEKWWAENVRVMVDGRLLLVTKRDSAGPIYTKSVSYGHLLAAFVRHRRKG